jgi:3-hydroxyisobutyrate dehydrogenase-like beta-hydroxyacid dehydrogenase
MADPVGFVGLGVMGRRIALRLCAAGHSVVVYTRTKSHLTPLLDAGAEAVASPATVTERCETVLSCLLDTQAIEQVYLGELGLMSRPRAGQVFVEHGTFAPDLARRLATTAAGNNAAFLDAPITGGPEGAREGTLVAMVGGDRAVVHRLRSIFAAYTREVVHVGAAGAGLELKLINQLLVTCHVAAAAEAAALLRRLGLAPAASFDVLTSGWADSAMLRRCLGPALGAPPAEAGAGVDGLLASAQPILALAARAGVDLHVFPRGAELLALASGAGLGHEDVGALVEVIDPTGPRSEMP